MLNLRPKGRRFGPHWRHCVVSLSKNMNPSLVLVQPRNTRPFITERLLMGRKESNQTKKQNKQKICWSIAGIVKEEDNVFFPPWVPGSRTSSSPFVFKPKLPPHKPTPKSLYNNKYSKHARDGFQYWYSEPQPIDCKYFSIQTNEIFYKAMKYLKSGSSMYTLRGHIL